MWKKKKIDPEYYDNHDFGDELMEAKRNGTLLVTLPGECALDAIKRYRAEQKKVSVNARVPAGLLNKGKERAAAAGVSWSSYISSILERAFAEPPQAKAGAHS